MSLTSCTEASLPKYTGPPAGEKPLEVGKVDSVGALHAKSAMERAKAVAFKGVR
jgi:hypothetical protein